MKKIDLVEDVPEAFLGLSEREHILFSPSIRGELITGSTETLIARTAVAAVVGLVHAAYKAQESSYQALSWRDFNVGSSAAMYNFETGYFGYLDGYNVKPESGKSSLNLHAEQISLAKGRRYGLDRMLGIAVYADPTDDDANPDQYPTLRPCSRCVGMFQDAKEVDNNLLILGTNQDFSNCEIYTLGSMTEDKNEILTDIIFPLQNEEDLDLFDHEIIPSLICKVMNIYTK